MLEVTRTMETVLILSLSLKCWPQNPCPKKVRKSLVLDPWEKEELGAQLFTEDNILDVQVSMGSISQDANT